MSKEYQAIWHRANPDKCHSYFRKWEQAHKSYLAAKQRERRKLLAGEIFRIYGNGCCAICGSIEDLTLDHLNGDGKQFRDSFNGRTMSGCHFYRWLRRNGYPKNLGLRVLCRSCNTKDWQKRRLERERIVSEPLV